MKKTDIEKTIALIEKLNNAMEALYDGDTVDNIFSKGDLEVLNETYFSELETLLSNEKAQYIWNRLTQNRTEEITGDLPSLAYVKEFCYYGEDLTPDHGARQILQANNKREATI
jgi:hypothetical protein